MRIRRARRIHIARWLFVLKTSRRGSAKPPTTDFPTAARLDYCYYLLSFDPSPRRPVFLLETARDSRCSIYLSCLLPPPASNLPSSFAPTIYLSICPANHSGDHSYFYYSVPALTAPCRLFSMHIIHPNSPELPGSLVSSKQARAEAPTNTNTDLQADMPDAILDDISHRRFNPLRSSWVLVSPHRTKRPWQGAQESAVKNELPDYDESVRPSGQRFRAGQIH